MYQQIYYPETKHSLDGFDEILNVDGTIYKNLEQCGKLKYELLYVSDLSLYKDDMVKFNFNDA